MGAWVLVSGIWYKLPEMGRATGNRLLVVRLGGLVSDVELHRAVDRILVDVDLTIEERHTGLADGDLDAVFVLE